MEKENIERIAPNFSSGTKQLKIDAYFTEKGIRAEYYNTALTGNSFFFLTSSKEDIRRIILTDKINEEEGVHIGNFSNNNLDLNKTGIERNIPRLLIGLFNHTANEIGSPLLG